MNHANPVTDQVRPRIESILHLTQSHPNKILFFTRFILALGIWLSNMPVRATDAIVFQDGVDGYDGTRDNTIYEDRATNSNGGQDMIFTGATASSIRRALLQFDVSQIPAGSIIQSVELLLELDLSGPQASNQQIHTLHRLSREWGEGTADSSSPDPPASPNPGGLGAPARDGDATWEQAKHNQVDWTTAGGDFVAAPSATFSVNSYNSAAPPDNIYTVGSEGSPGIVDDVQGWIDDPETNYGWIFIGDESGSRNARRFYSREATSGNRPKLTITYASPQTVVSPGLWSLYR